MWYYINTLRECDQLTIKMYSQNIWSFQTKIQIIYGMTHRHAVGLRIIIKIATPGPFVVALNCWTTFNVNLNRFLSSVTVTRATLQVDNWMSVACRISTLSIIVGISHWNYCLLHFLNYIYLSNWYLLYFCKWYMYIIININLQSRLYIVSAP